MYKVLFMSAVLLVTSGLVSKVNADGTGDVGSSLANENIAGLPIDGHLVVRNGDLIARLGIIGSGSYVCSAENAFEKIPVLGRGETSLEAQVLALQECKKASPDNGFFCKVSYCERDTVNGNTVSVAFDVVRDETNIDISFSGKVKYQCLVEGWGQNQYLAKAPTKTEALAVAKQICADDEGIRTNSAPNGFFCKADNKDCQQISGVKGDIGIGSLFNFFKKK